MINTKPTESGQIEEHRHIPIPEIIRGQAPGNIGIKPLTARCIECGILIPDHQDTERRWQDFLYRELDYDNNRRSKEKSTMRLL